jgi:hypothetical protein
MLKDLRPMTGHGFRAVARTILEGVLGFRPDIIEHQLAHPLKDPNGRAYNRTAHLAERRRCSNPQTQRCPKSAPAQKTPRLLTGLKPLVPAVGLEPIPHR